jgi:CRISPR-associated protein Cas2
MNHTPISFPSVVFTIFNSVFEGEMTPASFQKLKYEAGRLCNDETDSVIFFELNGKYMNKEILGTEKRPASNFI